MKKEIFAECLSRTYKHEHTTDIQTPDIKKNYSQESNERKLEENAMKCIILI